MNRIEIEDLLWEMSRLEEAANEAKPVDGALLDGLLTAYRSGRLTTDQAHQVERHLGRNLEARRKLESLSEITTPELSARARQRFLNATSAPARIHPGVAGSARRFPRWLLAAAAMLLTLTGGLYLVVREPAIAPVAIPEIQASIQGLSEIRAEGRAQGSRFTTAEPDTAVTIGVNVDPPRAGLAVGLYVYRPQAGTVVRLPIEPTWESRRKALFRARAASLVGESPGTYRLFAVIGRDDSMPPDRILGSGEGPEVAFRGLDLKVEPLQLEIVHAASPNLSGGSRD